MDFLLIALSIVAGLIALSILLVVCCLRFVTVHEATAVAFKYLGRFVYCAMEFSGHSFDANGSIVSVPGPNGYGSCWCIGRWGGWVFYLRPFVQPAEYSDYNDPDNFGDGVYVRLGDRTSEPYTAVAETADPENVGLNMQFVTTMRVVNPYRYLFVSPKDAKQQVINRQEAVLRAWVKSGDQKHAQAARGNGVHLWNSLLALGCGPIFDEIKNDWGLEIIPGKIVVKDVGFDPEYQAALKAQSQANLVAKAEAARVSAIDTAMDQWVRVNAKKMGKKLKDALVDLKADGSYDRQYRTYKDLILAGGGNLNVDRIEVGAPDGTQLSGNLGPIGALTALFGGRGGGRGGQGDRGGRRQGRELPPPPPGMI